jgi:hypothetical protein
MKASFIILIISLEDFFGSFGIAAATAKLVGLVTTIKSS